MPLKYGFHEGTYKYYKDTIEYTNLYPNLILTHFSITVGPYGPDLGGTGSQGWSERVEARGKVGEEKRVRVKIGVRIKVEIREMRDVREIGIRGVRDEIVVIRDEIRDEIRILNN